MKKYLSKIQDVANTANAKVATAVTLLAFSTTPMAATNTTVLKDGVDGANSLFTSAITAVSSLLVLVGLYFWGKLGVAMSRGQQSQDNKLALFVSGLILVAAGGGVLWSIFASDFLGGASSGGYSAGKLGTSSGT